MGLGAMVGRPINFGKLTQTAGTVINRFIPPIKGCRPVIKKVVFTNGATAHTLTIFSTLARARVYSAAAAAATSIVLNKDPGIFTTDEAGNTKGWTPSVANNGIAANDWIAVMLPDGNWYVAQCGACTTDGDTGRVTIASLTVPTGGILANAPVHFLGLTTDTNPNTGLAHPQFAGVASATEIFAEEDGIASAPFLGDAMLIQSNNATNAGTIDRVEGFYAPYNAA